MSLALLLSIGMIEAADPGARGRWTVDVAAGPSFAFFGPIDRGEDAEHLVTGGDTQSLGAGCAWEWSRLELFLGARLHHLHLNVAGTYKAEQRDDVYRASYSYVGLQLEARIESRLGGHVDVWGGLAVGPTAFVSYRQGAPTRARPLPVLGSFSVGFALHLTAWLDGRAGIDWVPPFTNLQVFSPTVSVRAKF